MGISIEIKGTDEAIKKLDLNNKKILGAMQDGLNKSALFIKGEVQESIAGRRNEPTSVDTGRFLNSIDFEVSQFNASIFTDIEYAKFLEWGTSKLDPRRHFTNTALRNKARVQIMIKDAINS